MRNVLGITEAGKEALDTSVPQCLASSSTVVQPQRKAMSLKEEPCRSCSSNATVKRENLTEPVALKSYAKGTASSSKCLRSCSPLVAVSRKCGGACAMFGSFGNFLSARCCR